MNILDIIKKQKKETDPRNHKAKVMRARRSNPALKMEDILTPEELEEHRRYQREYNKNYYGNHKENAKRSAKEWMENNKERWDSYLKEWKEENDVDGRNYRKYFLKYRNKRNEYHKKRHDNKNDRIERILES